MACYSYDPSNIGEYGKDRMRFELGDTMVEDGANTSALTDEEINAMLELYPKRWKKAKLALLESICRRFSYEPDTKAGPVTFSFGERAKIWREDYSVLKKEVAREYVKVPKFCGGKVTDSYFYSGMMENVEAK